MKDFSRTVRGYCRLWLVFLTGICLSFAGAVQADDGLPAKVKQALAELKDGSMKLGAAKIDGENLMFGTTKMNGNFELVDAIKTKYNATATIFIKKSDGFVRITTNVMKDGQRAVGTQLDPKGPAIAAIRKGEAFYGIVDILGKLYETGYEPIRSESGEILGIFYVGFSVE